MILVKKRQKYYAVEDLIADQLDDDEREMGKTFWAKPADANGKVVGDYEEVKVGTTTWEVLRDVNIVE